MSGDTNNEFCKLQQSEQIKKDDKLDEYLQYGKYQASRVWLMGSLLAFAGAFSYAHPVFLLADPPDWWCEQTGVVACHKEVEGEWPSIFYFLSHFRHISGRESICEGGNVIFNTSHPSYFKSLLVDELWICNDVRRFNGIPLPF